MTAYKSTNYTASRVTVPSNKYPVGDDGGTVRILRDKITLVTADGLAGLNVSDTIDFGKIPAGAIVIDAYAKLNKSLGATGIFDVGFTATVDEDEATLAADSDAFIKSVDGGGQAALQRADVNSLTGISRRFGNAETLVQAICTEVMDDSVLDAVLEVCIFYVIN